MAPLVLRAGATLDGWGVAAGLAGTTCMATGVMLTKRWGRSLPVLAATGWQLVAGGLVLTPVMFALEGAATGADRRERGRPPVARLVGTALAYTLWFRGAESLPVQRVSLLSLCSPLVATAVGWLASANRSPPPAGRPARSGPGAVGLSARHFPASEGGR